MNLVKVGLSVVAIGFCVALIPRVVARVIAQGNDKQTADAFFKDGQFSEAEKLYRRVVAESPNDYDAMLRLGSIALLSNRLDDAQSWLTKASSLKPEEKAPKSMLGETHYRRDQFTDTASYFIAAGRTTKAQKLESFKKTVPYQVEATNDTTRLKFVYTDPLPLVRVSVNGSEEANFLIDTGAGELILDIEFAKKIGATQFGSEQWTFGGDQKAEMGEGRVESVKLGDFVVKNVPVNILSTKRFSAAANGKTVDGIIGTILLYHFIATLDYPRAELVLRQRTQESRAQLDQEISSEKPITIPFWLAGDHLIFARGTIGLSRPTLFYVDTGLAGAAFTGPKSIIEEARIQIPVGGETEGEGGGGRVRITPFAISDLSLGDAKEKNLTGIFGAFPASMEDRYGFRIGGLISHQFFKPYAVTFDFAKMNLLLERPSQPAPVQSSQPDRFTPVAEKLIAAINSGDSDAASSLFGGQMRQMFPPEKAKAFLQSLVAQRGRVLRMEPAQVVAANQANFLLHFEHADLNMKLYLDDQSRIAGLGFTPVTVEKKEPTAEIRVRLPFTGSWLVDQGGDTADLNNHHDAPNQVYAFDFLAVGPDGKTYSGDGKKNEDYYGFGREVVATAEGTVTDVIEGVRDSQPGSPNMFQAMGNAIFIEHKPGAVSVFAHLKLGSTRVKVGDKVKAAQVIGLVGHSGGGRVPHLHYHVQNSPVFQEGKGVKISFANVVVTRAGKSERMDFYSPVRGEIVSPP